MKVIELPDVEPRPRRVAVGTFDGVHLGHREVIAGNDTVLTFDPHPRSVVLPDNAPQLLTTLDRKAQLIAALGVAELVVVPFDRGWAHQSPETFVDEVLVGTLGATHVTVGENFRFGHKASGDTAQLAADARFETRVAPMLEVDGEIVSSSHIRGLVAGGAVEYADRLLGDPFQVRGEVVHGDKRGRTLGYPTANIVPPDGFVIPGHGVYACVVHVGDEAVPETGRGELIEAFLIDWSGDLYGQELRIDFLKRLRGERRFPSVDDLVEQMGRDVLHAVATVSGRK
jgi:riboflavin kinase/FMN adenylyltransferase